MNDDFNRLSEAVMEHITALNRSKTTRKAYSRCFCCLSTYLNEKGVAYSQDEAALWLSSVSSQVNKTELSLFTAAVNKLNDLYLYGEVRKGHYDPQKTIAGKLCPEFKHVHSRLLEHISELAEDTVSAHSRQCASILLRLQGNGIHSVSGVTYDILLDEYNCSAKKTYYTRCMHHANLRLLLQFLYDEGLVPYGFTLFVDAMTLRTGTCWNRMPEDQVSALRSSQDNTGTGLDVFLEMRETVLHEHCHENYSRTTRMGIIRITNLFYLFMDMNRLYYSPAVGEVWLCSVKPSLDDIEYKHFRRVLCLMAQLHRKEPLRLNSCFVFRKTVYQRLPDWCRPVVDCFLRIKTGEGWDASTISMYEHSICRFCISIDAMGVKSFKSLSVWDVKQFNLNDRHDTPEGKNAYNSRIRKFLQFLGENHISDNAFLFLALPCVSAKREALVVTLTEDEQEALQRIFREEDTTISLREKAMIQLGLYMGIRQSDIIGLTIDDIDWDDVTIRIIQDKTDYEIILPMPTPVANALFRYIMKERPDTDSRSIFIRKYAPFQQVGRNACNNALNNALPERDVPGSGFHVTRKTYASNLLHNDVPVQHVAEALGHRGLAAVHKYLSLEEQRMRLCGLSLHDRGLTIKGGLCHV